MNVTRRDALSKLFTGTAVVAVGGTSLVTITGTAHAENVGAPKNAVGMLYDATRCIGCQSCVVACAQANELKPDTRVSNLHYVSHELSSFTKNIIKLYKETGSSQYSYVKQQCMHCLDPACVAGCSFFALSKDAKTGLVSWESNKCVGCRYCEISCPYHVPKFQWEGYNPKIVKCELCKDRLAKGEQPACTSVCPTHAVIFGKREELLAEAKSRVKANPGKYYQERVYGERDNGGTQVLYLSKVPFEKLGLPEGEVESVPQKYLKWQKRLYSYLVLPVGLYATLVTVIRKNFDEHREHMHEDQKKTGLRPQL